MTDYEGYQACYYLDHIIRFDNIPYKLHKTRATLDDELFNDDEGKFGKWKTKKWFNSYSQNGGNVTYDKDYKNGLVQSNATISGYNNERSATLKFYYANPNAYRRVIGAIANSVRINTYKDKYEFITSDYFTTDIKYKYYLDTDAESKLKKNAGLTFHRINTKNESRDMKEENWE